MSYLYERPTLELRLGREQANALVSANGGNGDKSAFMPLLPQFHNNVSSAAAGHTRTTTGYDKNFYKNTLFEDTASNRFEVEGPGNANPNYINSQYGWKILAGKYELYYEVELIIDGSSAYSDSYFYFDSTSTALDNFFKSMLSYPQGMNSTIAPLMVKSWSALPVLDISLSGGQTTFGSKVASTSRYIQHFTMHMELNVSSTISPYVMGGSTANQYNSGRSLYYKLVKVG